jgi:hypothetical protein
MCAQIFNNVHKRQLFHWVGRGIEKAVAKREMTAQEGRKKYLEYLGDNLWHGLPIKRPEDPEYLGGRKEYPALDLPMACFTEWALSESRAHTTRYGKMAYGFSKQWVMKYSGQPVSYYSGAKSGQFLKTLAATHQFLARLKQQPLSLASDGETPGWLKTGAVTDELDRLFYLLHFTKPFAPPAERKKRSGSSVVRKMVKAKGGARVPVVRAPRAVTRPSGQLLEYLEEREWRIVRPRWKTLPPDPLGRFDSRLNFAAGTDLFSIVLPDHETVKMARDDEKIQRQLDAAKVPVLIISFKDIGTF